MSIEHHPGYIHHQNSTTASVIREVVFGLEDGMVSTLGAITGIAIGTGDHFTTILSGVVIIAVESISMGVGSYISSKSEREIQEQKLKEEQTELHQYPEEEKRELIDMYRADGFSQSLSEQMAEEASRNNDLFLKEMALRELKVFQDDLENPGKNGLCMGISYIFGGMFPLFPYFLFSNLSVSLPTSVGITLLGLFSLGVFTTKFTKRVWWKSGLEMFLLATMAAGVGYGIGRFASVMWGIEV